MNDHFRRKKDLCSFDLQSKLSERNKSNRNNIFSLNITKITNILQYLMSEYQNTKNPILGYRV